MKSRFRYSIGNLLVTFVVVALVLTVVVQHGRHLVELARYDREIDQLRTRLHAAELALPGLPVGDPEKAYILAKPAHAYGRWIWRVYLPSRRLYALHIDVGTADDEGKITPARGHAQHMGLRADGVTTIIVEQFDKEGNPLIGASVGKADTVCRLTPEVDRCMADRPYYQEEQLGGWGVVELEADERIDLLRRWYPPAGPRRNRAGWLFRLARAAGGPRFLNSVGRSRFQLTQEVPVIGGAHWPFQEAGPAQVAGVA